MTFFWPGIEPTRYRVKEEDRRLLLSVEDMNWMPPIYYGTLVLAVFFAACAGEPTTESGLPLFPGTECIEYGHVPRHSVEMLASLLQLFGTFGLSIPFALYRHAVVSKLYTRVKRSIELIGCSKKDGEGGLEAVIIDGQRYAADEVIGPRHFMVTNTAPVIRGGDPTLRGGAMSKPAFVTTTRAYDLDANVIVDALATAIEGKKVVAPSASYDPLGTSLVVYGIHSTVMLPIFGLAIFPTAVGSHGCTMASPFIWMGLRPFVAVTLSQCLLALVVSEVTARWLARTRDGLARRTLTILNEEHRRQKRDPYRVAASGASR